MAMYTGIPCMLACSGYKITVGNKTMVGSNEDAWRVTPHLWFEKGRGDGPFGAAFTGSRFDGDNGYAPQSGMNEVGLAFERLVSYHPIQEKFTNRKTITNPTQYLKNILHTCQTVEEVRDYISQYDYSYFVEDVFFYVDKSGKYLLVEPYSLTLGNEPSYVISNFCPSITSSQRANQLDRYRKGVAFLTNGLDTTLSFCTALSDTMHVCRNKIGDGTLLSSIWDLNEGTINLYFYHDYSRTVQFNLQEELGKKDRIIAIETLFPPNAEFEKLKQFKIPKNNAVQGIFLVASAGLFLVSSFFFIIQFFRRPANQRYGYIQVLLFVLGLILFYYMVVLSGSVNVYYFPAPYKDPSNVFVSMSSYIPFLLLLLILPLALINYRLIKEKSWTVLARGLFTLNNLVYSVLIGFFFYWRFYEVF